MQPFAPPSLSKLIPITPPHGNDFVFLSMGPSLYLSLRKGKSVSLFVLSSPSPGQSHRRLLKNFVAGPLAAGLPPPLHFLDVPHSSSPIAPCFHRVFSLFLILKALLLPSGPTTAQSLFARLFGYGQMLTDLLFFFCLHYAPLRLI